MSGPTDRAWRGPGPGRPAELAPPTARLALRRGGSWRKAWRYVALMAESHMLCAASVRVGPVGQTFWAVLDRETGRLTERTRPTLPLARREVSSAVIDGDRASTKLGADGERVRASIRSRGLEVELELGAGEWVECVCPTGEGGHVWTRKRAGVPARAEIELDGRRLVVEGRGIVDESAGHHPRHTVWSWSAGVGTAIDGRDVAWNLVEGVNDPARGSERAVWIEGTPHEPAPATFHGLDAVELATGERLRFEAEAERSRTESLLLISYSYRQPFGRFSGTLPGGIELAEGLGVMEHHDARW